MKVGEGAGYALADIANGLPTDEIRERWKRGDYGAEGERPTGEAMAAWLKLDGRA